MNERTRALIASISAAGLTAAIAACSNSLNTAASGDAQTTPAAPQSCAQLVAYNDPTVTISSAEALDSALLSTSIPGAEAARIDVSHCRVVGMIDSTIGFELLMPVEWNGKFIMGGGGGFVGSIQNHAQDTGIVHGGTALERGYATAGTDTGHQGNSFEASWALNNPQAVEDFAHRAIHRTTEVSKAIIASYYSGNAERAYFFGCSRGGGQAMISAQRYPDDFDGIVAGAPAIDWTGVMSAMINTQRHIYPDPANTGAPVVTAANRELLTTSILAQCDAIDGVEDGLLTDPRACSFDPTSLPRCDAGASASCLSATQLEAVQSVYEPLIVDGEEIYPGWPYGGETVGWPFWVTRAEGTPPLPPGVPPNAHFGFGTEFFRNFVYNDPQWTYADYEFADFADRAASVAALLNSTDPDLSAFHDAGGKLILWHGWSDAALSARDSIDYYESVSAQDAAAAEYLRMFLLPGVAHCTGGPGPDRVDWISAIESWVERDRAPEQMPASKFDAAGSLTLQRPVCAWPASAAYDGAGDPGSAANFSCAAP